MIAQPIKSPGRRAARGVLLARLRGRAGRPSRSSAIACWSRARGALLIALLGGYLVAARLGRRVGRLERAARHVARGRFMDPLPVTSKDELGQLTRDVQRDAGAAAAASTSRARSSSPPPRTSCARRSSRSAASSSCSRTRTSTRTPAREFLETMSEQVERLQKLVGGPARPLAARRRLGRARHRAGGPRRARALGGRRVPSARWRSTAPTLELTCRTEGPSAACDRERVAQIMRILLDNALRHTPEGTHVTVSATATTAPPSSRWRTPAPACRPARAARSSSASTPATRAARCRARPRHRPRAGRADGRAHRCSRRTPGSTVFTLELPRTVTAREARRRRLPPRRCSLAAAGCDVNGDGGDERAAASPRAEVDDRPACRSSRDSARRAASTRPRSTTASRPAWSRSCRSSAAARACSRTSGEGGQGSGFVLDGDGYIATNAHVVTTGPRRRDRTRADRGLRRVLRRQPRAGARSSAHDPNADVALLKVDPAGLTLTPLRLGAVRARSRSASPSRRSAARSASSSRSRSAWSRRSTARSSRSTAVRDRRRDPDRRRDQPRQLRRAAARRRGPR